MPEWYKGGWPYEGGGYWFEGLVGLGQQLKDEKLIGLARRRFAAVTDNMTPHSILFFWWLDRNKPDDLRSAEGRDMPEPEWPMWASGLLAAPATG